MSERAIEFVETWVEEKIEDEGLPMPGAPSPAKEWAAACLAAASQEGIPQSEIDEVFDDLAAFIDGQIEEANDRNRDEDEDEDGDDEDDDDGDGDDEKDDDGKNAGS